MRSKVDGLENRAMQQDLRFSLWIGGVAEVVEVPVGAEAADDGAPRRRGDRLALGAHGDFAVAADADAGSLTPDVRPPRTGGNGTEDGAFFGPGLVPGGLGRGAQFAVDFVLVDVGQQLVEPPVGAGEFADLVGGQQRRQTFLPVVVAALDFPFGLGGGGVAESHAVEVQGGSQLGEGVGGVGEEEGVVVHIEGQRQAVGLEDAGEEVQVDQEGFAFVKASAEVIARRVVQEVEQDLFVGAVGQEGVRGGVVLPEGGVVAGLPAFDGFGAGLVAGVGGPLVFDGPAADAGTVRFEREAAEQFAGGGAVGRGRFGGEQFGEQRRDLGRPVGGAAGEAGRPSLRVPLGTGRAGIGCRACSSQRGRGPVPARRPERRVARRDGGPEGDEGREPTAV